MTVKVGTEDVAKKRTDIQLHDVPMMSISDLLTTNAEKFFTISDLKCEFLNHPEDYREGLHTVNHLYVVNDTAERGVKVLKRLQ